jgi:hypothetical protein
MRSASLLVSPISKEARALAFPWLACLAAMILPALFDSPRELAGISVPAYFIAMAALGALSIGHEYTGRTVSLLLSLPVQRKHLLAIKLLVLAVMLLALWFVGDTVVFGDARLPQTIRQTASWVPVFGGLFLAPWLTMVCRSAVGGAVFTFGIEGTLYIVGELLGTRLYGSAVMPAFRLVFVWYGTIGFCVIGAIGAWRTFMRLEAIEGPGQHIYIPHWLSGSSAADAAAAHFTRRDPAWLLVRKELHLQQLPLALAGLFALGAVVALWMASRSADPVYRSLFSAFTVLYAGLLPLLIGASASAGERQIGTLEWQVLQPIAAWEQWGIKVAVVFGLVTVLAVGLPMILSGLGEPLRFPGTFTDFQPDGWLFMALMLLTAGSVYMSSLCRSTIWALVMSIPATMAVTAFFQLAWFRVAVRAERVAREWAMQLLLGHTIDSESVMAISKGLDVASILGFIALTLRFAFMNHRVADHSSARLWRQPIMLAIFVLGGVLLHSTVAGIIAANGVLQLPPQFR